MSYIEHIYIHTYIQHIYIATYVATYIHTYVVASLIIDEITTQFMFELSTYVLQYR